MINRILITVMLLLAVSTQAYAEKVGGIEIGSRGIKCTGFNINGSDISKIDSSYNNIGVMSLKNGAITPENITNAVNAVSACKENFDKMIDILEQWNYKIDRNKEVFEQIEKIANRIQGIKTKIELLRAKLDEGQKEKADKPNFEKELINITRILELHHRLKIKELNVAEFIGYQKQAQEVVESQNKAKK